MVRWLQRSRSKVSRIQGMVACKCPVISKRHCPVVSSNGRPNFPTARAYPPVGAGTREAHFYRVRLLAPIAASDHSPVGHGHQVIGAVKCVLLIGGDGIDVPPVLRQGAVLPFPHLAAVHNVVALAGPVDRKSVV